MVFRSKHTLELWLNEFRATREGCSFVTVLLQDGDNGADTGLVVVPLRNVNTEIYMEPVTTGDTQWCINFGARPEPFDISPTQLHGLAAELAAAAALCVFLQEKSANHDELPV